MSERRRLDSTAATIHGAPDNRRWMSIMSDRSGRVDRTLTIAASGDDRLGTDIDGQILDVSDDLNEEGFYATGEGEPTLVTRYDIEKAVPDEIKDEFVAVGRYWVNEPYALALVLEPEFEGAEQYHLIEPHLDSVEEAIYAESRDVLGEWIETHPEALKALRDDEKGIGRTIRRLLRDAGLLDGEESIPTDGPLGAADDPSLKLETATSLDVTLDERNVERIRYYIDRDMLGDGKIDGIRRDIEHIEDISCNGPDTPVYIYHSEYEQMATNVRYTEAELDAFVRRLADRYGDGVSGRRSHVEVELCDGSLVQLTHDSTPGPGESNYTIRQFQDAPLTPIDLINWHTYGIDAMAFLWMAIEHEKSVLFAGGTASGKTTGMSAAAHFVPSSAKIAWVGEGGRQLPHLNQLVLKRDRPKAPRGGRTTADLLEASLRHRPRYIAIPEVYGADARTYLQAARTGHTTLAAYHGDSIDEVVNGLTSDPVDASTFSLNALDVIAVQTLTRVADSVQSDETASSRKVRRSRTLAEVRGYEEEADRLDVRSLFEWSASTDKYEETDESTLLEEIQFEQGWTEKRMDAELGKRRIVLAYLVREEITEYRDVVLAIQLFMREPERVLSWITTDTLAENLQEFHQEETIDLRIAEERATHISRPVPSDRTVAVANEILAENRELLEEYAPDERSFEL